LKLLVIFQDAESWTVIGSDFGFTLHLGHFGTPCDSSRLGHTGMILSSRATEETDDFAHAINRSLDNDARRDALQIKQTIVTAVGRRGKWRT
jgi:hypothetical protein